MRWFRLFPFMLVAQFLPSCGSKLGKPEIEPNPFGPTGVPPQLRVGSQGGTPVKAGGNVAPTPSDYRPEDLAWTNPDDADAEMPELVELLAVAPQKGPWKESETDALRDSKNSGKPLLIWFTDNSPRCPACKSISTNLFARSDFETWAAENTVRLIVDQAVQGKTLEDDARKKLYVRGLKKKYSVRGFPTLLVLSPSGEVIGRYKSYRKGQEDFVLGQLKQGVMLSNESHGSWRAAMEKKGYREWSGGKGRVIFAKLAAYKEGELVLVEPDGQRARTHENNLSAGDRVWIQQQKEMRGIR